MSESFWDFSLRTYRSPHVPEACLCLQNERGVDVNILLFCSWFGLTRGQQEAEFFQDCFEFSENWASHVVRPLRGVRSWMKTEGFQDPRMATKTAMDFREKVKAVELNAEMIQQQALESLVLGLSDKQQSNEDKLKAIVANIRLYFATVNIIFDDLVRENLLTVIQAAAIEIAPEDIQTLLKAE